MPAHSDPRARKAAAPPTAKGQRTRQRLVDAAEVIFGEIGFERASIVEITRSAGVALGTFYVYFPTKQAIFAELVDTLGHGLRRGLAEATEGLGDRLAIERAGCRAFLDYVLAHRGLYRIVRQAEFVDPALYQGYYRRLAESYQEGLGRAMDAGELRRLDPETLAYALMGIFDFLGMRWVIWEGRRPPDRLVDDVFALIRGGLAPTGEAGVREATRAATGATKRADDGKKPAEKKPAATKRTAAKKKPAKRPAATKSTAATKRTAAKKPAEKPAATKRTAAKKKPARKPTAKKSTALTKKAGEEATARRIRRAR